ncbi:hypothetical protein CHARACLAT_024538 [Characodon lateralis]|uniref:Uncharacterized protein n=1 Tax=Characodon lateralis TaxID=208331 RepID=A0ABU7EMI1_9TELE|nr:hypothetical protein [Characodon lateralis]
MDVANQLVAQGQFTVVKQPLGFIKVLQWLCECASNSSLSSWVTASQSASTLRRPGRMNHLSERVYVLQRQAAGRAACQSSCSFWIIMGMYPERNRDFPFFRKGERSQTSAIFIQILELNPVKLGSKE